jgi:hypothetical protein
VADVATSTASVDDRLARVAAQVGRTTQFVDETRLEAVRLSSLSDELEMFTSVFQYQVAVPAGDAAPAPARVPAGARAGSGEEV